MHYLSDRVFAWMTHEPLVGVMMVVGTIVLFVGAYRRGGADQADGFFAWTRRAVEAAATALLFLALLWGFRSVLGDNARGFETNHGRVTDANYQSVRTIWGAPHVQRELEASLEGVEGDAIAGFDGTIHMTLDERQKGSALYSGFQADVELEYAIHNSAPHTALARLFLPLGEQPLLEDLHVWNGGVELEDPTLHPDGMRWERSIAPDETLQIRVRYRTRGLELLYYQVPQRRNIRDFRLAIDVSGLAVDDVNYPDFCLTPTAIEPTDDGVRLLWTLDRAVTTSGMGIALPRPEQPGSKVALVLDRSPYALMLLVVAVGLTLMVRRESVSFLDLSLLSSAYCVVFLTMASASDYLLGFWGSLGVGAGLTLALSWWLYRRHPARRSIAVLVVFFAAVFPLAGLLPDHREAFDGAVSIGLIVYLFALALRTRTPAPLTGPIDEHTPTPPPA
jgi:hypothetical protein